MLLCCLFYVTSLQAKSFVLVYWANRFFFSVEFIQLQERMRESAPKKFERMRRVFCFVLLFVTLFFMLRTHCEPFHISRCLIREKLCNLGYWTSHRIFFFFWVVSGAYEEMDFSGLFLFYTVKKINVSSVFYTILLYQEIISKSDSKNFISFKQTNGW
jgi:hypothetical protein